MLKIISYFKRLFLRKSLNYIVLFVTSIQQFIEIENWWFYLLTLFQKFYSQVSRTLTNTNRVLKSKSPQTINNFSFSHIRVNRLYLSLLKPLSLLLLKRIFRFNESRHEICSSIPCKKSISYPLTAPAHVFLIETLLMKTPLFTPLISSIPFHLKTVNGAREKNNNRRGESKLHVYVLCCS